MDFENYTLGRLVRDRGNYDDTHPEYRKILRQVLGRVRELGWTAEAFAKVDDSIGSDGYLRRREENTTRRVDRYGKKYSWIAYHEQAGMRADLGLMEASHRNCSDRSSEVDVDPSFPHPRREERVHSENWLAGAQQALPDWIARGPLPDTTPLLRRGVIFDEKGPWLMLDGYFTQQDKVTGRDLFCFVRAFLAPKKDEKPLVAALKKQSMRGRWLPEKPTEVYAYAGEFPWCSTYEIYPTVTMRFVTKRWTETVLRRRTHKLTVIAQMRQAFDSMLVGKEGELEQTRAKKTTQSQLVEGQEIREEATELEVTIPVCDFQWEGPTIDDQHVSGVFLAKPIAQALNLRLIPGTHDVADSQGRRATCNTSYGADSREDRQQAFFVREDLLMNYLRRTKQVLITVSWGERGAAHHLAEQISKNRAAFGETFKVFHTVRTLKPDKTTA